MIGDWRGFSKDNVMCSSLLKADEAVQIPGNWWSQGSDRVRWAPGRAWWRSDGKAPGISTLYHFSPNTDYSLTSPKTKSLDKSRKNLLELCASDIMVNEEDTSHNTQHLVISLRRITIDSRSTKETTVLLILQTGSFLVKDGRKTGALFSKYTSIRRAKRRAKSKFLY